MSVGGRTPEARWSVLNPGVPYFDGRCEVIVSYNYEHRCRKGAVSMNEYGFAVCEVHSKICRFRDEGAPASQFVVEQFDERAARFRFGHLEPAVSPLALRVRALEAQWDF